MKKLCFLFILLSCLTGCLNTATIKERALVQMMGIDYDPTYSKFIVTLQVFSPEGGGGKTSIDSSKQNVKYIQNEGTNLYEAVKNITLKQGKIPFYGDNRIIIIGESAAKESLAQIMGYLNNDHEARSNMKILVAKGQAAEIIQTPLGHGIIPAQGVSEMIQHGFVNGKVFSTNLLDLGQAYTSNTISPVIPVIQMDEQVKSDKEKNESSKTNNQSNDSGSESSSSIKPISEFKLDGTAVFKQNKLIGYLTENETRGLLFLRNHIRETLYPGKTDKVEYSTVQIYRSKQKTKMTQDKDKLIMTVNIRASGNLKEFLLGTDIEFLSDQDINQLEKNISTQIEADCKAVVDKAINDYDVDLFYFGDIIWKSDPDLWKKIKNEKLDYLKNIEVRYQIEVNLNRVGLEQVLETK